jgi:ABC-type uncharacterized transport system substrate-binding protein
MRRREFIAPFGGAAAAWPLAVHAQQLPLVGVLSSRSAKDSAKLIAAFQDGLRTSGLIDGVNAKIEYRYADGEYDKLPVLAAELIKRQPNVIVTTGSEPSALAAQAATSTIPIVFVIGGDPVKCGLVPNLNRPPGNITGDKRVEFRLGVEACGVATRIASASPSHRVPCEPEES